VDARDLAAFVLRLTTEALPGPFNVVGPTSTMKDLADAWRSVVRDAAPVDWDPPEDRFHLPADGTNDGTFQLDNTRALAAGLTLRSPESSAHDYVAWIKSGNTPPPPPH
jgi:2'-hydroxyisoflavone reductase